MALCNLVRRTAYPQKQLNTEAIKYEKQYETKALAKYENMFFDNFVNIKQSIKPNLPGSLFGAMMRKDLIVKKLQEDLLILFANFKYTKIRFLFYAH